MAYDVAEAVRTVLSAGVDPAGYGAPSGVNEDALLDNPYAFFDRARSRYGNVFELPNGELDGVDMGGMWRLEKSYPCFAALSYSACSTVLSGQDKVYGVATEKTMKVFWGETPITTDPPAHTPLRALTVKALNRMQIQRLEHEVIRPAAEQLADGIARNGGGNLITEYTGLIPFLTIAHLMGVNPGDMNWIFDRTRTLNTLGTDWDGALKAAMDIRAYLDGIYEARLARPGEDLMSDLIAAEVDGVRLSREQVLSFCRLLLPAGFSTTTKEFGSMMCALLNDPEQMDLVRSDRSLIPAAIDEAARMEPPIMFSPRRVREDTVLEGVALPAGSYVMVCTGVADHDPSRWENPHVYDLRRPRQHTVAFGIGPHFCPGSQLAKTEMNVGLNVLLEKLPNLRLAAGAPAPRVRGFQYRACAEILVEV